MTAMSTIAAVGATLAPERRAFAASVGPVTEVAGKAPQAVILDIGGTAAARIQSPPAPDKIDGVLSLVAGANGFAALYARTDWAGIVAEFGKGAASRDKEAALDALVSSASKAFSAASSLGIPIHDSVSPDAVRNGAAPGTISVGPVPFASGGSSAATASQAPTAKPDPAKLDVSA